MAPLQPFLQPGSGRAIPSGRDLQFPTRAPQERTLHAHPEQRGVLVEATRDGDDFIRICGLHQYASPSTPGHAPACPFCVCDAEQRQGRRRYAGLRADGVRIVGNWC